MGKGSAQRAPVPRKRPVELHVSSASAIVVRGKSGPVLPHLRRGRRADVERRILANQRSTVIAEEVAKEWWVSVRTVWDDIETIRKRHEREDARRGHERRGRVLRRMEGAAVGLYAAGELDTASLVDYRLGRLLGMGGQQKAGAAASGVALLVAGGRAALPLDSFATDPEAMAAVRLLRDRVLKAKEPDKPADAVVTNGHAGG